MARTPKETDFFVNVEDVGKFTFAKRTMREELAIQAEFARVIDGTVPTPWLEALAIWISTLTVLTVRAPDEWDLEGCDPLDPDTYTRLKKVYDALCAKEQSFRSPAKQAGHEGRSVDTEPVDRVLVQAPVQPDQH